MISLRGYQSGIITSAQDVMRRGVRRYLIVMPTGSGKTAISTHIISASAKRGLTSFFLCHRQELIDQTEATFAKAGVDYGVIAAGRGRILDRQTHICSIDTVRRRIDRVPTPNLVVIDEAAHVVARSWRAVVEAWPDAYRIGLTATPQRLSGEGFEGIFDELVEGPSVRELIDAGWVSKFRYYAPPGVDPSGLHTRAGDYVTSEAAALVDRAGITGNVIEHYNRLAGGKRAIVFCADIAHSQHVAADFAAAGIPALHVDGKTPAGERRYAMEQFRAGEVQVLTNVGLFLEGVDVPALEAVILLRPTKSLALFLQAVGRGLRVAEGKSECVILDHVGCVEMHGFPDEPRQWSLHGRVGRARAANDNEPVPAIRICPNCYAAFSPAPVCPYCSTASVPSKREIEQRDGELAELKRKELEQQRLAARREQGKTQTVQELTALGRQRGYKNPRYWAEQVMRGRTKRGIIR